MVISMEIDKQLISNGWLKTNKQAFCDAQNELSCHISGEHAIQTVCASLKTNSWSVWYSIIILCSLMYLYYEHYDRMTEKKDFCGKA